MMQERNYMLESDQRLISYAEAIREATDQCMAADGNVIVMGEGVPDPKSIFGTTAGLKEKYGKYRVFDMPLSENGVTGICIGAALSGVRPIMVHQRIDFMLLAMDQIVNNAAKWHYMFNGQSSVPLVIRAIIGRGWGQGPQHSQGLHGMFAQVPGLKVVMPSTAYDAKGMLVSALEDNNPVVFIEHRWLHNIKDNVPESMFRVPLDKARVLRRGSDVTIAAFSYGAIESLEASKALEQCFGISCEVLDMRSVRPLDVVSVINSIGKTGKLLIVDTAFRSGGISGELLGQVIEAGFDKLTMAPMRMTLPDYPAPTSTFMTKDYYYDSLGIAQAVLKLCQLDENDERYMKLLSITKSTRRHDVPNNDFMGPF
jgi:pyruvate/2-oxoglutarate/acetoin dehydrogenase E1 component